MEAHEGKEMVGLMFLQLLLKFCSGGFITGIQTVVDENCIKGQVCWTQVDENHGIQNVAATKSGKDEHGRKVLMHDGTPCMINAAGHLAGLLKSSTFTAVIPLLPILDLAFP